MRFVRKVYFYALKLFVANFIQKERRMRSVERLQLAEAEIITLGAFDKADLESWKVSIAVVDDAGVLLSFRKMDGSSNSSVQTALKRERRREGTEGREVDRAQSARHERIPWRIPVAHFSLLTSLHSLLA